MNDFKNICDICHAEIKGGEIYRYKLKVLCEECCLNIRTPRLRKTHWQYLKSIEAEYLITGKNEQ